MPHLAEELLAAAGPAGMLVEAPWPAADPALAVDEAVTVAVQVNGKLRGDLIRCRRDLRMPPRKRRRWPTSMSEGHWRARRRAG